MAFKAGRGGKRVPNAGRNIRRDERGANHSTVLEDFAPASVVFMGQDRVERVLAHDSDAYRVRRMLESRDLWSVVPALPMAASTAYERAFFEDTFIDTPFSHKASVARVAHLRALTRLAQSRHAEARARLGMKPKMYMRRGMD